MGDTHKNLGISEAEYEHLLSVSDHRCWICRQPEHVPNRRLAVDHDHRTGAVRGLLCTRCNRRLGATVDAEWLRLAAEYLDVASRAFGDSCRVCGASPLPRLVHALDGDRAVFEYTCCGRVWRHTHVHTTGIPGLWLCGGVPIPR